MKQIKFNPAVHYLGKLCRCKHEYQHSGKSMLYIRGQYCVLCKQERGEANKEWHRQYNKTYYLQNKEKIKAMQKIWNIKNATKMRAYYRRYYLKNRDQKISYAKAYYKKNYVARKQYWNAWFRMQIANNTNYAIGKKIARRVKVALNTYSDTGKIIQSAKQYGIDYDAIIKYLGPHPNHRGMKGQWHIDHIIPLSKFDLNDPAQIMLAFAPENHQWLPAKVNLQKGNHIPTQVNCFVQKQLETIMQKGSTHGC